MDFVGPIKPQGKTSARYIITATEYLTHWAEAQLKSTPYHPQANGTIEAFNKILETTLTKVCNTQRSDWDLRVPVVLWAYRTTCKKLMRHTAFRLVYGMEVVIPMEYSVPSLHIAVLTGMTDREALEDRLVQLEELKEEQFLAGFHQHVQN
eukprot:PITA_18727